MHESLFNNKVTLSTPSGLSSVKVDISKSDTGIEARLIDTSNIFSLWVCSISSSDFYILKRDQDILVDYDRFIQVLVNLFHGAATGRYTASFNDGVLRFIENSEFRNICKLELKFTRPEETQYRRYLGDLVGRMEADNIKLIKENAILRERCVTGDQAIKDKARFLEQENSELRRRGEHMQKDLAMLGEKERIKDEEIAKLSSRIYAVEEENGQLRYEVERYERENSVSVREQLKRREAELDEMKKEIDTANEIIKKLRAENSELREFRQKKEDINRKETEKRTELEEKLEEAERKLSHIEAKYKKMKEEAREKGNKAEELTEMNKVLMKRLENAQNVYNHFYSKKIDDQGENYSDTFSLRPESPPGR